MTATCKVDGCERPVRKVGMCGACYTKDWKARNPEKVAALKEKYRAEGRFTAAHNRWRAKNPDYERNWNAAHKESRRESMRKWQERNKEHLAAYNAAYIKTRPEANRQKWQRYRARQLANANYQISAKDMRRLYSSPCFYCGRKEESMTVDHVIPLIRGGANGIGNLVTACRSCNSSKQHWLLAEFRYRKLPMILARAV
jgi:5-methylcytosine-specific restriction endonuclease McrA